MAFSRFFSRLHRKLRRPRTPASSGPLLIADNVRFEFPERIHLGRYIRISKDCYLNGQGGIQIGDGTILGPEVVILSSTHRHRQSSFLPYDQYDEFRPVTVGCGVWLGYRAMVVPGVTIADGAIVAMGAVVVKDVSPGTIVGGNPAQVVGQRDADWIAQTVREERFYMKAVLEQGLKRIKSHPAPPEGSARS